MFSYFRSFCFSLESIYRFGDGYTILIRTNAESSTPRVNSYIKDRISSAIIREEHNKLIHFRVSTDVRLHEMFNVLEKAREEMSDIIEDYTVTQVTLDDVFVTFAKGEKEKDDESNDVPKKDSWWKRTIMCKLLKKERTRNVGKCTNMLFDQFVT